MIRYLDLASVIAINEKFSDSGVRDETVLRSAVYQCQQGAFGQDLHPTLEEKAATLLRGIARNHAFIDGNKRTALNSCETFLEANGFVLAAERGELVDFVLKTAQGQLELEDLTKQVANWMKPTERNLSNGIH